MQARARTLFRSDEALSYSPSRASSSMEMPTLILVGRIADSAIVLLVLPHEARQALGSGWVGRSVARSCRQRPTGPRLKRTVCGGVARLLHPPDRPSARLEGVAQHPRRMHPVTSEKSPETAGVAQHTLSRRVRRKAAPSRGRGNSTR